MSHISRVEISGLWGDRNLVLNLFEDVNFLIGPNGSGKTTAINTIAATLTGDFVNLDRLPFRSIVVTLHDPVTQRRQSVEVTKKERQRSPFPAIDYSIKDGSAKATQYSLDALAEERLYREYYTTGRTRQSLYRHVTADLTQRLRELAPTSWLSIHRAPGTRPGRDERSHEFTVDQKLDEISNSLVRFFSELEKKATDEAHKFQETIFLSLIYKHKQDELFRAVQDLDIQKEKKALIDIFKNFKVPESSFVEMVQEHFAMLSDAMDTFERRKNPLTVENIFIIMNSWRIHSVIRDWHGLLEKQQLIFKSRDAFLDVINDMLQKKELAINAKNEIYAKTRSGKILSPSELSSGEKQLLIILGEALLQKEASWIYIADEPELSLHVDWQVVLVDNLRHMNPASQIIVATHSPDIVSHYAERVHDMEEMLS
jgi:predicted ATPase